MPETIVPQAQAVRAEAERLLRTPQSPRQSMHGLPKHFPTAAVQALLWEVVDLAKQAEYQARELARFQEQEAAKNAAFLAQIDEWEAQEEARQFMEACAAEHQFYPALLAG